MDADAVRILFDNTFGESFGVTDDPVPASDKELADLAYACAEELRKRYPRYALEQGDIDDAAEVRRREEFAAAADTFREATDA